MTCSVPNGIGSVVTGAWPLRAKRAGSNVWKGVGGREVGLGGREVGFGRREVWFGGREVWFGCWEVGFGRWEVGFGGRE